MRALNRASFNLKAAIRRSESLSKTLIKCVSNLFNLNIAQKYFNGNSSVLKSLAGRDCMEVMQCDQNRLDETCAKNCNGNPHVDCYFIHWKSGSEIKTSQELEGTEREWYCVTWVQGLFPLSHNRVRSWQTDLMRIIISYLFCPFWTHLQSKSFKEMLLAS